MTEPLNLKSQPFYRSAPTGLPRTQQHHMEALSVDRTRSLMEELGGQSPQPGALAGTEPDTEYFRLFNARNCKLLACALITIVLLYHGFIRLYYQEDTCVGLLEDGRYQGEHIWQPYGCMLHMYSKTEARMCMKYKKYWGGENWIVLVGDERMQQLWLRLRQLLAADSDASLSSADAVFTDQSLNLTLEFLWEPRVDDSLRKRLARISERKKLPGLLLLGSAIWSLKEGGEMVAERYGRNVSVLLPSLEMMRSQTRVLWVSSAPLVESKVQPNSSSRYRNKVLDKFSRQASSSLRQSSVKLWESARLLSAGFNQDSADGVQLGSVALNYDAQILLNFYCNDLMNFGDGSCCSGAEPLTRIQSCFFVVACICIVGCMSLYVCRRRSTQSRRLPTSAVEISPISSAVPSLAKIFALVFFFFACDRANVFMKENKWFTHFNFFLPIVYMSVLGLFFTEETSKTGFLHREQTEEWKGWMILVVMCFQVTGAEQDFRIYMGFCCLVSSFLVILGYGHFQYLWTTGDFSLKRVFRKLLQYNFLAGVLCLAMNRSYQFYFFVPLISYWFLVCYVTLALPPQVTAASVQANPLHYFVMVLKLVALFAFVSVLYLSEVFFEKVFLMWPWKALFVTPEDDVQSWWLVWRLHRYSMGLGMSLGFVSNVLRSHLLLSDAQPSNLFSRRLSIALALLSVLGLALYSGVIYGCRGKSDCSELHAYLAPLPILSFVVLRNVFGCVRRRASTLFAWFGRIYLEVMVAGTHVWLAADGEGVLVLLPRWPVLNALTTWMVAVCAAHECRAAVTALVRGLVVESSRPVDD